MKGNSNPRYSRRVVRRKIARLLKAEVEVAQLKAQRDELQKIVQQFEETMLDIHREFHRGMGSFKKVDEKLPVNMVK